MRVFAEYINHQGLEYRRRTLIQYGDSLNLIGSAVLKNPGSALPERPVTSQELIGINSFYQTEVKAELWQVFNVGKDATIRDFLPKLFNGYYACGSTHELNGIIQLFNLFYIREPNSARANAQVTTKASSYAYEMPQELVQLLAHKPVYLGWGKVHRLNSKTKELSKQLFNYQKQTSCCYLKPNFEDNSFYHPQYLNIAYKTRAKTVVKDFWNLLSQLQ